MIYRVALVLGALLAAFSLGQATAAGQTFAVFSPQTVQALPALKGSAAGRAVLAGADAAMERAPQPMARVHTEGTLQHQGIRDQSQAAERDWPLALQFALAYRLTGEARYLAQASRYLDAWLSVYKVSGNPIDETGLASMVYAFDLTRGALKPEVEGRGLAFSRQLAVTYLDWLDQNFEKDKDNWSSHRVKLAVLGAYASGDAGLIHRGDVAFHRHERQNIRPDGSVDDFYKRDALHYVVYDVEPLEVAALAARAHGLDWFHTAVGKPSLEMALDWLEPYATGRQTHEEFRNSKVAFDAAREKAGESGFSGPWEPKSSIELYAIATWLDPRYRATLNTVITNANSRVQPWIVLAIEASHAAQ